MTTKVSVDERRRRVAESLQVGNPGNNARDLGARLDPQADCQIDLAVPVHRHERRRDGVMPSASAVMHQLAWELIPALKGVYAGEPQRREKAS